MTARSTRAPLGTTRFFVFLCTVLTVLYARYRTVFAARRALEGGSVSEAPTPAPATE